MSRPLRIQQPGLWHHVTHRSSESRHIADDDGDRRILLGLLAECGTRFGVWAGAVCLMDTHYHLLLCDEFGRLGRAMRHLNGVYTQGFNRRHGREGPLFRGRYRSRVVEEEGYLIEVIRYIHANPVDAGLVERAADYPWSSHRHYVDSLDAPWLRKDLVADLIGDGAERLHWFEGFVHERVDAEMRARLEPKRWSPVLGSEGFADSFRTRLRSDVGLRNAEIPDAVRMAGLDPEEVLSVASRVFEMSPRDLRAGRRGTLNLPRLIALMVCRDHTAAKAEDLALLFGVRRPTVAVLASKARRLVGEDEEAAKAWRALNDGLVAIIQQAT
jgi:REP element-mobilizing transposase RayT